MPSASAPNTPQPKTAIIIGAGPAGLTAAYELLEHTDVIPVIYEMTGDIGGISKTVVYKGNRIDIGGHRFFSKSDWVMAWWQKILPLQGKPSWDDLRLGREGFQNQDPQAPDPEKDDGVMLVRRRLSRIYFLRKFFNYPVTLDASTLRNLGFKRIVKIGLSYLRIRLFPIRHERSLEDFFTNRFGRELYRTFFQDYTEKVWGMPCASIPSEWGAQRVQGLSITRVLIHALRSLVTRDTDIGQKKTATTLISQFLYPKHGPGQLWEEVARRIQARGGRIVFHQKAVAFETEGDRVAAVAFADQETGTRRRVAGDYVISTMPVPDLIAGLPQAQVPEPVRAVSRGLLFRDFITVGLLVKKLKIKNLTSIQTVNNLVPDNWIYIQEREVKLGRLQIFNNWSPYLLKNPDHVWMGLEYFCNEGDALSSKTDEEFAAFAAKELASIQMIEPEDVLDSVVIRMPKTYPCYFGTYDQMPVVRDFTDRFANLFLIGRNGMHRYNNMAHSMMTAKAAVDLIREGRKEKDAIWAHTIEEDAAEKKLTSVENLTEGLLKEALGGGFEYHPDEYWLSAGISYTAMPTVRHRKRYILNALKRYPFSEQTMVFDYGCGIGNVMAAVKDRYRLKPEQIGGCDISKEALEIARRRVDTPHLYNAFFPALSRPCDIIICTEVIEHTADYAKILAWIWRNLKPGGWLILTTQSGKIHASDLYTGHTQHFHRRALEQHLRGLEFQITSSRLWGFPLFTLQKYLTDLNFDKVKAGYVEGPLNPRRKFVFDLAYLCFKLQDWIPFGPQIYMTARKPN